LWRSGAAGNDPHLNAVFLAEPTVDNSDARLVDAAIHRQVFSCEVAQQICLADATRATSIRNDVGGSGRIVLQLNPKVVQTSF
jgi:hypothetical protein